METQNNKPHQKFIFLKTYGCQMNEYDSHAMIKLMEKQHNMILTDDIDIADLLVMNTCSIRDKAQEKVFSELGRWKQLKDKNPNCVIAVSGCVASQEGQDLLKRAPVIDLILGPQTIHKLPLMYQSFLHHRQPICDVSFPEIEKFDNLPIHSHSISSYLSIMEGCSKYCSYCVVPYTRGEEISRPFNSVLKEAHKLAESGTKEIHLLGQNVNDYLGKMSDTEHPADLALLIQYIASIESIQRIRFTTSHPTAFSDNLILAYEEEPKLVNHLHLPVQSGSNRILSHMKRGYTHEHYRERVEKLRNVRPDISLSSDFIVGYPGETDKDFEATMNLIHDIKFDHSFSFIFSPRPGTPAAEMDDPIPLLEKKARLKLLQETITLNTNKISMNMLHTTQKVLITGPSKKNPLEWQGRTENNRVVNIPASSLSQGQLVNIMITKVNNNSLRGRLTS
ncbi:MAG TPA: tRNA (N6-isopentenyl adenosine(37)-C2)-methylthiotransferase MiaB [Gammaproteobacteria bacterium]|nr:tRNA (N6-isopentenyl adenosine(37)-C2)-methylthiotransferase MiaB [Gammaproteobacteria bacterium]